MFLVDRWKYGRQFETSHLKKLRAQFVVVRKQQKNQQYKTPQTSTINLEAYGETIKATSR